MLGGQDRIDEAWELMQRGLALRREVSGDSDPRLADALNNLSYLQLRRGDVHAAIATLGEVRDLRVELFGEVSRPVVETIVNLAYMAGQAGDNAREIELLEQAMALGRQLPPPDDLVIVTAGSNLALNLAIAKRKPEAVGVYDESLAMALERLGPDHRTVADSRLGLSFILRDLREYERVAEQLPEAIRIYERLEPDGSPRLAKAMHHLGEAVYHQGDSEGALQLFRDSLAMRRRLLPADHEDVGAVMADIVTLLDRLERFDEAREVLVEYERVYREAGPSSAEQHRACLSGLAEMCEKLGLLAEAAAWRDELRDARGAAAP